MGAEWGNGLVVLHGNRLELLKDAVFQWLAARPLAPLEPEVFLVQSNGVAEWLKMALAEARGVCAAARVELPARFLWRSYRQVLGREAVPAQSPLDEVPLTWRLMRLLPALLAAPGFEPLARFLNGGDIQRRLQLARKLADLFDQYQVHRADWLDDWAQGHDRLRRADGQFEPLPDDQRWQPLLWRALLQELDAVQRLAVRPGIQQRFLAALDAADAAPAGLPRRVVAFGLSQLPMQTLHALSGMARHSQVMLALVNPCQYHWADVIEGRELLRLQRQRLPLRGGRDLAAVSLEEMHVHAHPLLAAWGRQGRDFVRQLDAFDQLRTGEDAALPRIDLFDGDDAADGAAPTLLAQVQAAIRDLQPLAEHPREGGRADGSIVFHVAHSAQREVEVLHDELLTLLAGPPPEGRAPLRPRDVAVMVPDIDQFAPAIRAVFGQYPPGDARHIPWAITDLRQRGHDPLVLALEWLLRLPQQRCRVTEVRALLEVPAVSARFDVGEAELERLSQWLAGSGVRWGLDAQHRAGLGLDACGAQNTWVFGLRRMLLGYAVGDGAAWQDIEAYGDVGGLEAAAAGSLAVLVDELGRWLAQAATPATPAQWGERARALLEAFFLPDGEEDRCRIGALHEALHAWLQACAEGGFDEAVPLEALREGWLNGLDEPSLSQRFLSGGVTFCTLMPMRSIPFEVVCLLGMNDGDYPRRTHRADFDLLALPGQRRPGDRSRRDDDRYLMLEALLAARRRLHVSWSGRSVRDNSEQPPSVLVAQLREYLGAGFGGPALLKALTVEHPLQPFSRRYFEAGSPLRTWAREWRAAHAAQDAAAAAAALPAFEPGGAPVTVARLVAFLRNPVAEFFKVRLGVNFDEDASQEEDEPFGLDQLQVWQLLDELLDGAERATAAQLEHRAQRLLRAGRLPLGALGERQRQALLTPARWMHTRWLQAQQDFAAAAPKAALRVAHDDVVLEDWLDQLREGAHGPVRLELDPGVLQVKGVAKPHKLLKAWVRQLAASAAGVPLHARVVSRDAVLALAPLPQDEAQAHLQTLLSAWRQGMQAPLPLACRTALAHVADAAAARGAFEGSDFGSGRAEGEEPCLARLFPDFEALAGDGRFEAFAQQLYAPLAQWAQGRVSVLEALQDGADAAAATTAAEGEA